jgi:hypothetical protein
MQKKHIAICFMFAICLINLLWNYLSLSASQRRQKDSQQQLKKGFLDLSEGKIFCAAHSKLCEYNRAVKERLSIRHLFTARVPKPNPHIYVHGSVKGWFGEAPWLGIPSLAECDVSCTVTGDSNNADVIVSLIELPQDYRDDMIYAVLNLEAYSLKYPINVSNVALMSYLQQSEVVINYGYSVMHSLGVCVGDAEGVRPNGQRCENMRTRESGFYRWCKAGYGGDFFTCVFNVVPHVLRTAPAGNKSAGALGVAWISAVCERHGNYLGELMEHMRIDSMGGCYRNRDENSHPALLVKVYISSLSCLICSFSLFC